jgi:hypothetical protein
VRFLLIGFMFFACFGLLTKGLGMLGVIGDVPMWLNGAVFLAILTWCTRAILKHRKSE